MRTYKSSDVMLKGKTIILSSFTHTHATYFKECSKGTCLHKLIKKVKQQKTPLCFTIKKKILLFVLHRKVKQFSKNCLKKNIVGPKCSVSSEESV